MATSVPRSLFAATFEKVKATKAANVIAEREEQQRRLACPVEQAKTYLRQRGFNVFKCNILPGERLSCEHIMVGLRRLTPTEVILMAESHRDRIGHKDAA